MIYMSIHIHINIIEPTPVTAFFAISRNFVNIFGYIDQAVEHASLWITQDPRDPAVRVIG